MFYDGIYRRNYRVLITQLVEQDTHNDKIMNLNMQVSMVYGLEDITHLLSLQGIRHVRERLSKLKEGFFPLIVENMKRVSKQDLS